MQLANGEQFSRRVHESVAFKHDSPTFWSHVHFQTFFLSRNLCSSCTLNMSLLASSRQDSGMMYPSFSMRGCSTFDIIRLASRLPALSQMLEVASAASTKTTEGSCNTAASVHITKLLPSILNFYLEGYHRTEAFQDAMYVSFICSACEAHELSACQLSSVTAHYQAWTWELHSPELRRIASKSRTDSHFREESIKQHTTIHVSALWREASSRTFDHKPTATSTS
jgi:hypothetical protein